MNILMNIIVLIFEVLYYSMFMYYAKKEGKFWRYILLFSLITILILILGSNNLISYIFFVLIALMGLKYFIKIKASLYDMLIIILMVVAKLLVEFIICMITFVIFKNTIISIFIANVIKICLLLLCNHKLNIIYNKLHIIWDKNNFYIRYVFICLTYIYVIVSILFMLYR